MAAERSGISEAPHGAGAPTTAELIDRLSRFDGPPEQFLLNLLAVQCYLAAASGGAILRPGKEGAQVLAVYPAIPEGSTAPVWLAQAAEMTQQASATGGTTIRPLRMPDEMYGQPSSHHLVMVPIRGGSAARSTAAYYIEARDSGALAAARERLELTVSLLSFYEMRLALQRRTVDLQRIRLAMETLSAINEQEHFAGAAMTMCNEIASRVQCDRVGLGFLKGRYVQLKALSHTEKFNRKMKIVQDIEAAMEECLDQDVETYHPAPPEVTFVGRAAKELSGRHGPTAVASLPMRRAGNAIAVFTVERPLDKPFTLEEMEAMRLTCDLCTARLGNLYEHDRWFGARMAAAARKGLAAAVGPKHTWVKLTAVIVLGLILMLIFGKGDFDAGGSFTFQATEQRVVPVPFDGYLQDVQVDQAQVVHKGQALANLDASQLYTELAGREAERAAALIKAATAWGSDKNDKRAEAMVAEYEAKKIDADIAQLNWKIGHASIVSPIDGTIITGDLKRLIGKRVQTGDVLFEIAPLDMLRAELAIPEDQIAEVRDGVDGQSGELATANYPDQRIEFKVDRIIPVAEVVDQRNIFKVRAALPPDVLKTHPWIKPGMEGVAKVHIGKKPYGELWTRQIVNWVRMKLWI